MDGPILDPLGCVGHTYGHPHPFQHRHVHQPVADIDDLFGRQSKFFQEQLQGRQFVQVALVDVGDVHLSGPGSGGLGVPSRDQGQGQLGLAGDGRTHAIIDSKPLKLIIVGAHVDGAIGQDAIHVGKDGLDPLDTSQFLLSHDRSSPDRCCGKPAVP